MQPNPKGRRRGRQRGRESPQVEGLLPRLCPVLADWQPWAFEPREQTPPPVCASVAWPTSGLKLAKHIQAPKSSRVL